MNSEWLRQFSRMFEIRDAVRLVSKTKPIRHAVVARRGGEEKGLMPQGHP
jgi:hypothetical protein